MVRVPVEIGKLIFHCVACVIPIHAPLVSRIRAGLPYESMFCRGYASSFAIHRVFSATYVMVCQTVDMNLLWFIDFLQFGH